VRWRPLSTHSPQAFLEVLLHSLQHVGRNCCHFFPDVLLQIHGCPWFLFVHFALEISSEEELLRLGTLAPMNIKVATKYPLSQDRIVVFEIRLHSKRPMLYRPALHGNWNALSFAERAHKDKFPRQRFHSQLCYQIVRYFCRTLYLLVGHFKCSTRIRIQSALFSLPKQKIRKETLIRPDNRLLTL